MASVSKVLPWTASVQRALQACSGHPPPTCPVLQAPGPATPTHRVSVLRQKSVAEGLECSLDSMGFPRSILASGRVGPPPSCGARGLLSDIQMKPAEVTSLHPFPNTHTHRPKITQRQPSSLGLVDVAVGA